MLTTPAHVCFLVGQDVGADWCVQGSIRENRVRARGWGRAGSQGAGADCPHLLPFLEGPVRRHMTLWNGLQVSRRGRGCQRETGSTTNTGKQRALPPPTPNVSYGSRKPPLDRSTTYQLPERISYMSWLQK